MLCHAYSECWGWLVVRTLQTSPGRPPYWNLLHHDSPNALTSTIRADDRQGAFHLRSVMLGTSVAAGWRWKFRRGHRADLPIPNLHHHLSPSTLTLATRAYSCQTEASSWSAILCTSVFAGWSWNSSRCRQAVFLTSNLLHARQHSVPAFKIHNCTLNRDGLKIRGEIHTWHALYFGRLVGIDGFGSLADLDAAAWWTIRHNNRCRKPPQVSKKSYTWVYNVHWGQDTILHGEYMFLVDTLDIYPSRWLIH